MSSNPETAITFDTAITAQDWLDLANEALTFAADINKACHNRRWWQMRAQICFDKSRELSMSKDATETAVSVKRKRRSFMKMLVVAGGCAFCFNMRKALALGVNEGNPPEIRAWMVRQYSTGGSDAWGRFAQSIHCCDDKDVHVVGSHDWRPANEMETKNGILYYVTIDGLEYPINKHQLVRDPLEDPNPVGEAVVWYTPSVGTIGGRMIYCFSPYEWKT